jgi:hypothetical protein
VTTDEKYATASDNENMYVLHSARKGLLQLHTAPILWTLKGKRFLVADKMALAGSLITRTSAR